MFAKLKQKIEEGGTDLAKELSPAQRNGGAASPLLSRRNLADYVRKQYGSNESLMSDSSIQNEVSVSSSKEISANDSMGSPVGKSSVQHREFDLKIREMTRALREEVNKREKVERVLEKQQDLLAKRIEEKDEEWKSKLATLLKENAQVTSSLAEANIWIERFAKSHEVVEELEGFQMQEISKLKHLLLVSQQQLKTSNDALKCKEDELELKSRSISSLMQENQTLKQRLEENNSSASFVINDVEEKGESGEKLLESNRLLDEERQKYHNLEKRLSELQDDYNSLKCLNSTVQEKSPLEYQLEEKVRVLEEQLRLINANVDHVIAENSPIINATNSMEDQREIASSSIEIDDLKIERDGSIDDQKDGLAVSCEVCPSSTSLSEIQNEHCDSENRHHFECRNLVAKLQDAEEQLRVSLESEHLMKNQCSQLESTISVLASERETLTQLNKQLMAELSSIKEDLLKTQCELDSTVDQLKQVNDDLGLAESEKQNLLVMLAEFRQSASDAQNANSEASRLEVLTLNLQDQITEKNKAIKLQQQQISDMKKALQRELKLQSCLETNCNDSSDRNLQFPKYSNAMFGSLQRDRPASLSEKLDEVNFKYVKHVVLKFMTSTESEAHHLIRAIGVLLDFTSDEEQLVRQTLDWKMSWFGSKPQKRTISKAACRKSLRHSTCQHRLRLPN